MKKYSILCGIALICIMALNQGCTNDAAYPEICFTTQVLPIYAANCAITGCHDGNPSSHVPHDVILNSYANIMKGIKPYHPQRSKYYTEINGFLGIGEGSMPPTKPLSSQQISLIKAWIEQGAQESNCSNNSECDTSNITYSGTIAGIFATNCTPCHNASTTSGGVNMDGYTNLQAELNANKTGLLSAIAYNSSTKMPPSYKLSACEITQINIWIKAGYPNN